MSTSARCIVLFLLMGLSLLCAGALATSSDPLDLWASTLLGGSGIDGGWPRTPIAVTPDGHVIVAGKTASEDFPGVDVIGDGGASDAFIAVFDARLRVLKSAWRLGGEGDETCTSIAIAADGAVYVTGTTLSASFPTTPDAHHVHGAGAGDIFIVRLAPGLDGMEAIVSLGGSSSENAPAVAVDATGAVLVAGRTQSADFPVSATAYDTTYDPARSSMAAGNVFVARLTADLSTVEAATFLGGTMADDHPSLAVADDGSVYVSGTTCDARFPVTPGAWETQPADDFSIYVCRLDGDLTRLLASTFVGGNLSFGYGLDVDADGSLWIAAHAGPSFPATGRDPFSGGIADAGIAHLTPDLSTLIAATVFGGSGNDCAMQIVAMEDVVVVSGFTDSADFPTSSPREGTTSPHSTDGFVVTLRAVDGGVVDVWLLDGQGEDELNALAVSSFGGIYVAGSTNSRDVAVLEDAAFPAYVGGATSGWGGDVYIACLAQRASDLP